MCYCGHILICTVISKHCYTHCALLYTLLLPAGAEKMALILLPLGGDLLKIMNAKNILPDLLISV